jgi:hypothetical protein
MKLSHDQPGGAPVRIYQCGWCGTARSCGVGSRTRYLVCLDDRSVPDPAVQVRGHVELGAVPVPVLQAQGQEVAVARDRLKRLHRTEMVSQRTPVDLFAALPDGLDVTEPHPRS